MAFEAYVLIEVEAGKVNGVVSGLNRIPAVVSADRVTGPYDIICLVELPSMDDLGPLVQDQIHKVGGIVRTLSCAVARPA
ncbi:MAG: Lrp/AsnC ligand binding domain-containing protein [Chloroflexi bacterium]|nr:Lrp/AsnC ligand binding domain-containing protein [Chloroflexota bacterium]